MLPRCYKLLSTSIRTVKLIESTMAEKDHLPQQETNEQQWRKTTLHLTLQNSQQPTNSNKNGYWELAVHWIKYAV